MTLEKDTNNSASDLSNSTPTVSIICQTFNHENFIESTIQGFLNQKTNFPIEIIVHDDASSDKTKEIINKYHTQYPDLIKPIYQTQNQYSQKINIWSHFTFPAAKGKYIALCEGDDYWTDELKLQKQVDFLEQNNNYSVCWTDFENIKGGEFFKNNFNELLPKEYSMDFDNAFGPYCTYSLTCMFKKDAVDIEFLKTFKSIKDNSLYSILLSKGNGMFLNYETAVYRLHAGGVYSMQPFFFQRYSSYKNLKEILEKIPESRTKNIYKINSELLQDAALEVLKIYKSNAKLTADHKDCIQFYISDAKFTRKIKYILRLGLIAISRLFKPKA